LAREISETRKTAAKEGKLLTAQFGADRAGLEEKLKEKGSTARSEALKKGVKDLSDLLTATTDLERELKVEEKLDFKAFTDAARAYNSASEKDKPSKAGDVLNAAESVLRSARSVVTKFEKEVYEVVQVDHPPPQGGGGLWPEVSPRCFTGLRLATESMVDNKLREATILDRRQDTVRSALRALNDIPTKGKRLQKVGVWTDGYTNLIAIFNF